MTRHRDRESGAALIVAMLLMLVFTIMLIGFYFVTSGEQKVSWSNRDNEVTYYWAMAGLEQMSSLIADYFSHTATPVPSTLTTWVSSASNFQTYPTTVSTSGVPLVTGTYTLYCAAPPTSGTCDVNTMTLSLCSSVSSLGYCVGPIGGNGPLQGLEGLVAPFKITVVADGPSNTEVKLSRTVQEVAVPIFEFGIFSDSDLSFHAGADFAFGGRVHTNGNLYLAEDGGSTLDLNDHVTAAKGIIREQLINGYTMGTYPSTSCEYSGTYCAYVNVLTTANGCPAGTDGTQTGNCLTLQTNQGSVEQGPGSTKNPNWQTLSLSTYNGYIQDGTTGAKVLNLAIALPGINSKPIAMIQRPPFGESPTSALGMARFYNQASVRILLSDTQSDIMNLPSVDSTEQPYPLAEAGSLGMTYTLARNNTVPSTYCPSSSNCTLPALSPLQPPFAESLGASTDSDYMTAAGTTSLGGYIKIEMNLASSPGTWKDVTEEILAQGISRDLMTPTVEVDLNSGGSLASGNTYYYVVTALGPWGPAGATAETLGMEYGPYTTTSTYKTISINWNAVTGATGYRVHRGSSAGGETGYLQYANTVKSYNETNAAVTAGSPPKNQSIVHLEEARPNTMPAPPNLAPSSSGGSLTSGTYYYVVTAVGPWGESVGTQANVTFGSGYNNKVTISWTALPGATGYNVYRTTNTDAQTSSPVFIGANNGCISCNTTAAGSPYIDTGSGTITAQLPPVVTLNSVTAAEYAPNFYPINMYDSREGEVRDTSGPTTSSLNGIMNLVEIDVGNLQQWFAGNIATSGVYVYNGPDALNNSGYILYSSDRRMNCMDGQYELDGTCSSDTWSSTTGLPTAGETAQFGNEDIINSPNTNGAPNNSLDTGEDVNGNGVLDTYGVYAHPIAAPSTTVSPSGTNQSGTWSHIIQSLSNSSTTHPAFVRITGTQGQKNSVVIFRRALRLVNGTLGNLPPLSAAHPSTGSACSGGTAGGFTVVSENPVYVVGDYNASVANGFNDAFPLCHVPSSVMGDAVTLLSNYWQPGVQLACSSGAGCVSSQYVSGDASSFASPTWSGATSGQQGCNLSPQQRCAANTYYRMAVMAGKTIPFPAYNGTTALLSWGVQDTGTDGGVHNFLRYIEDWSTGQTLNYMGSLASFYYSQQATGIYKCCNTVYGAPTRNYAFDTDFQNINKLPPGVPRFTDVNALSYYQSILPTQ